MYRHEIVINATLYQYVPISLICNDDDQRTWRYKSDPALFTLSTDPQEAGAISYDAPEKVGRRTAADRREIRSKEAQVRREQRRLPGGTQKGKLSTMIINTSLKKTI